MQIVPINIYFNLMRIINYMMSKFKPKKQEGEYQETVYLIKEIESKLNIADVSDDIVERAHNCIKALYTVSENKSDEKPIEEEASKTEPPTPKEQVVIPPVANEPICPQNLEKQLTEITAAIKSLESKCSSINNSVQSQANSLYDIEQVKQTRIEEIVQNCQDDR